MSTADAPAPHRAAPRRVRPRVAMLGSRVIGLRGQLRRAALRRHMTSVRRWLPQGQLLPEPVWRRRHAMIVALLTAHIAGLGAYGLVLGNDVGHVLLEMVPLAAAAAVARSERARPPLRVAAASVGLITSSAILVHLSGGTIEAHFHFFVMIAVLTLYQDWLPFLLAIGYVVVHHGVLGVVAPRSVYDHPAAIENPWKWAVIHGVFVLAASIANVIAWRTSEDQLRDQLTGLPSRVLFLSRLESALERRRRQRDAGVAVLFLDLDGFKLVNDSLGHPTGDKLIQAVANRLRHALRGHETLARFGGDEFAILCENVDERGAMGVGERVLECFASPFHLPHGEVFSATSIGIALATDLDEPCDDLIRNADAAMYRAKAQGGMRCVLFDEVTHERAVRRLDQEQSLRRAVERDELRVFFQPEVSVETGRVVGVEALVRWQHPERGLIGAGEFVALAEETGLIVPIGRWVLREACLRAQVWQALRGGDDLLHVSVNVSARQLADGSLPGLVDDVLAETGMKPTQLCLEITETMLMDDPERARVTLDLLKDRGVRLAIDDFGTGYSSLEHLRLFPFDELKIDGSFIASLPESSEDDAILSAVAALGRALGLSVTAEGVETVEQLAHVRSHGCHTAQGFLYSRPAPAEEIEAMIRRVEEETATRPTEWVASLRREHRPDRRPGQPVIRRRSS